MKKIILKMLDQGISKKTKLLVIALGLFLIYSFTPNSAKAAQTCECDDGLATATINITGGANTWQECNNYCKGNNHQRFRFASTSITAWQNTTNATKTPTEICRESGGTGLNARGRCEGCETNGKVTGAGAGSVCQTKADYDQAILAGTPNDYSLQNQSGSTRPTNTNNNGLMNANDVVPGTSVDANSGLVSCGRPGQKMCTLCDLLRGMNKIIHYLMQISIGVALAAITVGGVMYVVSPTDKGLVEKGKGAMGNAVIGFALLFAGYFIVNTIIQYVGTRPGMGVSTSGSFLWSDFKCDVQ